MTKLLASQVFLFHFRPLWTHIWWCFLLYFSIILSHTSVGNNKLLVFHLKLDMDRRDSHRVETRTSLTDWRRGGSYALALNSGNVPQSSSSTNVHGHHETVAYAGRTLYQNQQRVGKRKRKAQNIQIKLTYLKFLLERGCWLESFTASSLSSKDLLDTYQKTMFHRISKYSTLTDAHHDVHLMAEAAKTCLDLLGKTSSFSGHTVCDVNVTKKRVEMYVWR